MKKQIIKFGLIFVAFVLGLIACQQELRNEGPLKEAPIGVKEAQIWLETFYPYVISLKSANTGKSIKKYKPLWELAEISSNNKVEVVETHISTAGRFGYASTESFDEWLATGEPGYLNSLTKLIVLKYKKTGEMVSFLMTIVGNKPYLSQKCFELWDNKYLKKDKDFSGHVLFHNLEGEFVNGWRYIDGKITHRIELGGETDLALELKSAMVCETYTYVTYTDNCTDWWSVALFDGIPDWENANYMYSECEIIPEDISITECMLTSDEAAGSGGYAPSEDTQQQESAKLTEGLNTLFEKTTLSDPDIIKLNEAYEQMRMDCIFRYIDDYLHNNNVELNEISMNPGMLGQAGITSLGNLKFESSYDITSENLGHEWFHLFQKNYSDVNVFDKENTTGMAEFENALLKDVMYFVDINGQLQDVAYSWACVGKRDKHTDEYIAWLKELTNNGTGYPDIIMPLDFHYFSNLFGEVNRAYNVDRGYKYGVSSYAPTSLVHVLNYAKISCNN